MSRLVLLGITVTLVLAMPPASAFCQAAAESVLLNGASSSSALKAGSALNSGLNGASKRLAARIPQVSQPSPGEVHHPLLPQAHPQTQTTERKNSAGSVSQPGPMIVSVQGTRAACAPATANSAQTGNPDKTESAPANCQSGSLKPAPRDKYKSTITLSLPK
jgi:hypothetical protein